MDKEEIKRIEEIMNWLFIELSRVESNLRIRLADASGVKTTAVEEWNCAINRVPLESIGKKEEELAKQELECFNRRVATEGKEDRLVLLIHAVSFIKRKFSTLQKKEQLAQILLFLDELILFLNDYREKSSSLQEQIETIKRLGSRLREQVIIQKAIAN